MLPLVTAEHVLLVAVIVNVTADVETLLDEDSST
jgi:hypothetical protein